MRKTLAVTAALGIAALMACSPGSSGDSGGPASSGRSAAPSGAGAVSQAADLRTHLDLLLAEQVMLVAKETAAAVNHTDSYTGYTALLSSNLSDLNAVMRSAFGNTGGDEVAQTWNLENASLVAYGIGVVTHNDANASAAMTALTGDFVPKFANAVNDVSGLPNDPMTQLMTQQVLEDKALIDDLATQRYVNFYSDLQTAYAQTERIGDALAQRIAQKFPDKFPGDPTVPRVDRRVSLNLLLQQHAYLATMTTDAVFANRDPDKTAAAAALSLNADAISRALSDLFGAGAGSDFDKAWSARDAAIVAYAQKGDADSKSALTATVQPFATAARATVGPVQSELTALVKAIDDQRSKSSQQLAGDDRAAATSMQAVADGISGAGGG